MEWNYNTLILFMVFIISSVNAKTLPWRETGFSLRAREMPLSQVLSNLAENYDTSIIIDSEVNMNFSGLTRRGRR